ncbi:hypothetical protein [Fusibacter sp. 3D3]|uniref:hypothetical protein n=1 Tax=Fusibacter sp. 3D3 TaxID=1048380 RepID=UPI000852B1E4|nr:hypothetical protein [Fusibacter sp. 3D3]GAU78874.1 hypothetical protein F3D3_3510 [Fusibacter sp. 3D3]
MFDKKYLDAYSEHVKAEFEDEHLEANAQERILEKTFKKIELSSKGQKYRFKGIKQKKKSIVVACFLLLILSGFINATPVNALYQSIFQFIPGFGIVKSEEDMSISRATTQSYRMASNGAFIEIKYAYVQNNSFVISALTNINYGSSMMTMDGTGERIGVSGKSKLGLYLLIDGEKTYASHYVEASSYGTDVKKISGTFYLEKALKTSIVTLGIDDFEAPIEIVLEEVKAGDAPDKLGNGLFIDDIFIFADLKREGDVAILNMSSVLPSEYRNLRFYLFDDEKAFYASSIQIIDSEGNGYYPNEKKRQYNNADIDTFYFDIPEHKTGLKVVIPQMIYDTKVMGEVKVKKPKLGEYIAVDQRYKIGEIELNFKGLAFVSKENDETLKAIGEDALRYDFEATYQANSKQSVFQVFPEIKVKTGFEYARTNSMGIAPYWTSKQRAGCYYSVFDAQDKATKLSIEIKCSNVLIGPYELKIEAE